MDFHRYDKLNLNPKQEINEKIKSLFLLYDRDVHKYKVITHKEKIKALNHYINILIKAEEFEAVIAFKERKQIKLNKYKKDRRDYYPDLMYRFIRRKLYKFFIKKFKN
jgi:hypothetical protein